MRGILFGACLLVSNVLLAQCNFLSLDVCGPFVQGGPVCGEISVSCPGASDGVATASSFVWPSTGSVNYQWVANGDTLYGASVNNLSAAVYEVIATSSLGCSLSDIFTVLEPSMPLISTVVSDVSCFAFNDGQATVSVTGDYPPYTVDFGAEDPNQLFAGVHVFNVTDANGCQYQDSVTITQPAEVVVQHSVEHVECYGDSNGAIDVAMLSTGDFSFNWSTGDTTEDITTLTAGIYDVVITDSTNCSLTLQNIEVLQSDSLSLLLNVTDASCTSGQDGAVSVNITGGLAPYAYNYFGHQPDSLTAGDYIVEVSDSLGCVVSSQYTVSEPVALSVSISTFPVSCFNGDDGEAIVTPNGGVQPYAIDWYGEDETALMAGNYSVSVTDANNCAVDTSVVVIQPDSLFASFTTTDVSCYNTNDGYIEVDSVTGGTGSHTFLWDTGSDTLLTAGSYAVLLTDANGCAFSDTLTVNQPDSLEVLASITDVLCYGDSTGSANLLVSGGLSPYMIDWQGVDASMLGAGVFPFIISDANTCQLIDSVTISQPDELVLTAITNDVSCYGYTDGSVSVWAVGGTTPYSYDLGGIDTANLMAGYYEVFVVDDNACVDSIDFQISQPDLLTVSTIITDVSCYGFSDGQADLLIQGGTGLYTENWLGADPLNLSAGQYVFEVLDEHNCLFIDSVIVAEPDSLYADVVISDASCFGFSDGSVQLTPIGGVAPYQIDWAGQDSSAMGTGSYNFLITDYKGCVFDVIATIAENAEIDVQESITDALCYASSDGEILLTISGGKPPYSCMWSNGIHEVDNTGLSAGIYDLLVTDSIGCEQYKSFEVMQPDSIQFDFEVQLESCTGNGDGTLSVTAMGGTVPYIVQWNNGVEYWDLQNVEAGFYTLSLIDGNGCLAEDTISMTGEEPCFLLPTLFTPNNDNYNDSWNIQGMSKFPTAEIKVYTRSGQLVFDQVGYEEDWDGTYNGIPLPKGDYYFYLDLKDGSAIMQGVVTIKK